MTNGKDSQGSKIVGDKTDAQDWEFNVADPIEKLNGSDVKEKSQSVRTNNISRKQKILALDEASVPRTKTRSAMALEMQCKGDDELKDIYNFAPLPKRAVAFVLDIIFIATTIFAVKISSPLLRKIIQYFMDSYKLKFIISESLVMNFIMGISGFFAIFFFIIIPVSFFNVSFGKKILGLRVRGTEKYTLSISDSFKRELVLKPLSIIIIAGFITPFFSKKRLSIHDMLSNTFVIEE